MKMKIYKLFQQFKNCGFGSCAGCAVYDISAVHDYERRNAHYAELPRERGLLLYVHLTNLNVGILVRDLFHYRNYRAAGAAPRRPKVEEDFFIRRYYLILKIFLINIYS